MLVVWECVKSHVKGLKFWINDFILTRKTIAINIIRTINSLFSYSLIDGDGIVLELLQKIIYVFVIDLYIRQEDGIAVILLKVSYS